MPLLFHHHRPPPRYFITTIFHRRRVVFLRPVGGGGCSSNILRSTSRSDLSMWSSSSSTSQVWNSNNDQQPPSMLLYNSLPHRCTIRSLSRCDMGDGWNRRSFSSTTSSSSSSSVSTTPTTIYTTTGSTTTSCSSSDATNTPKHPTTVPTFHRLGIGMGQWNAIVSTDMDPTPTMIMGTTEEDEEEENANQTKNDTTMTSSSSSSPPSPTSPYAQMQQLMYQRIIETALFPLHHHHPSPHATSQSSISNTIEIGFQSDQDIAFVQAYRSIVQERLLQIQSPPLGEMDTTTTTTAETNQNPETTDPSVFSSSSPLLPLPPIHVLWRIGYREIPPVILPTSMADTIGADDSIAKSRTETTSPKTVTNTAIDPDAPDTSLSFLKEDPIYQQEYDNYERRRQQRQSTPFRTHAEDVIVPPDVTTARSIMTQPSKAIVRPGQLIHNISPEYIQHVLLGKSTNRTAATTNDTTVAASHSVEVQYESLAPLLQLKQDYPEAIRLIILLQNPETQYARYERGQRNLHPKIIGTTISDYLESLLYQSFTTLQSICDDGPKGDFHPSRWIDGYGVVSNGLSLYEGHPMHVSYRAIGQAAQRVYHNQVVGAKSNVITTTTNTNDHLPPSPKFCAIQLPANALENNGIAVATKIQQMKQEDILRCRSDQSTSPPSYLTNLNVIAMRPLKCFSDGGTGANATHPSTRKFRKHNNDDMISSLMIQSAQFPFTLVDYTVTQNMNRQEVSMFTNEMSQPPLAYNSSYQRAIQLFDGHEIIERQEERRYAAKKAQDKMKETEPLNVLLDTVLSDNQGGGSYGTDYLSDEERETLHGCQILLQMIQNCHEVLQNARCIQIHEMLLSQYVLPILSNQFASLDDQTSRTLEAYFTIYGPTMQYYVAHNTRQLLLHGETTTTGANGIDNGNHSNHQNENTVALSSPRYNHVPKTKRLQEFGLELLLQQQIKVFRPPINEGVTLLDPKNETSDIVNDLTANSRMTTTTTTTSNCNSSNKNTSVSLVNVFDTVMVGMATIEEVLDTMNIIQTYENETVPPHTNEKHDAI